ncbi:MAG: hypothetical protein JRC77_00960 [Deltaproteobacteria bacterium]|nr:hypothetical protein [Deltaproteobacteria bacterium]
MFGMTFRRRQQASISQQANQSMTRIGVTVIFGFLLGMGTTVYSDAVTDASGDQRVEQDDPYSTTARRDQAFTKTIRDAMRKLEDVNELDEKQREMVIALVTLTNTAALYEASELPRGIKVSKTIDEAFMSLPFELRILRQVSTISFACSDEMFQSHVAIEECSGFNDDTLCRPLRPLAKNEVICTRRAAEAMRSFLP